MATSHIEAKNGDFAKTVLMPGDPLRAKFIAENFLQDVKQVNGVRGMLGYTGTFEGKPVSVMASGMGAPSIGIYSYELFNFYDVENIIRIGSCGAISPKLKLKDIVVGIGACTDSNFAEQYKLGGTFAPICSYELLQKTEKVAKSLGIKITCGNILSSDVFYGDTDEILGWRKMGVLATEMEAVSLYLNAARHGKNAIAICTVSDIIGENERSTAVEREQSFTAMMKIALKVAIDV